MIETILSVLYWFARPSIAAWAGAVATIAACFLADPRRHLRRPGPFLRRIPRILIVWLIIAWILSQLGARGLGGAGTGGGRGGSQGPSILEGKNYGGSSTVVRIRFLPGVDEKERARDFACLVRIEPKAGITQEETIRAGDLLQFEQQLQAALRHVGERPGRVIVERRPYPGEGALKRIHAIVEKVWPDQVYEEVEP